MTYKYLAESLTVNLNRNNVPANGYDKFTFEDWRPNLREHMAVLYHHGGRCTDPMFGMVAFTPAAETCEDFDEACKLMLLDYLWKRFGVRIECDCPEELVLKLAVRGIPFSVKENGIR